jgi:tryptophan-rich sensory protein
MSNIKSWYKKLKKPSWAPKESVFGIVWGILYIIILIVNVYLIYKLAVGKITWIVALPFWLNLLFNFMFTPIQFGLRSNRLALVDILLILATLLWAMIAIFPDAWFITAAYIPYLIWVSIATALQISITYLNR